MQHAFHCVDWSAKCHVKVNRPMSAILGKDTGSLMEEAAASTLPARQSAYEFPLELLQRGAALACLVYGVGYWVKLVGIFPGPEWRFDLMPLYWQMAATPLAVLFPFAAVALWMLASWGLVVWVVCAGAEIIMYGFFPELYGRWPLIIILHLIVALAYATLRTLILFEQRRSQN